MSITWILFLMIMGISFVTGLFITYYQKYEQQKISDLIEVNSVGKFFDDNGFLNKIELDDFIESSSQNSSIYMEEEII